MNYPKNRYSTKKDHPWLDRDWLYEMYIVRNMRIEDIAAPFGCSPATIEKAAWTHGLHRDPLPRERKGEEKPYHNAEILRQLYVEEELNMTEIQFTQKTRKTKYALKDLY